MKYLIIASRAKEFYYLSYLPELSNSQWVYILEIHEKFLTESVLFHIVVALHVHICYIN